MKATSTQYQKTFPIGLNIHLISFALPKNVVKEKEGIRVSITTMPEENKQHYHLHGKKMYCTNHVFSLNITNKTKKVIMVFRKKQFFSEDPIIASTIIHSSDFPTLPEGMEHFDSDPISTEVKTLNIYYPLQKQIQEERAKGENTKQMVRKILGQMQVQLSFTAPYTTITKEKNNSKVKKDNNKIGGTKLHKSKKSNKKGQYEEINSQSKFDNVYVNENSLLQN